MKAQLVRRKFRSSIFYFINVEWWLELKQIYALYETTQLLGSLVNFVLKDSKLELCQEVQQSLIPSIPILDNNTFY